MISTVTIGKCSVGMLSRSGNKGGYALAASGPVPGALCLTCSSAW
jgi:hypothetical protein